MSLKFYRAAQKQGMGKHMALYKVHQARLF